MFYALACCFLYNLLFIVLPEYDIVERLRGPFAAFFRLALFERRGPFSGEEAESDEAQ